MRKRKGFTMVEAAISLFLVGLIIVAVYAAISGSIKLAAKDKIKAHAIHEIENLVTCYNVMEPDESTGSAVEDALALYLSGTAAPTDALDSLPDLTLYYDALGRIVAEENAAKWKISVTAVSVSGSRNYVFAASYTADGSEEIYKYTIPAYTLLPSEAE